MIEAQLSSSTKARQQNRPLAHRPSSALSKWSKKATQNNNEDTNPPLASLSHQVIHTSHNPRTVSTAVGGSTNNNNTASKEVRGNRRRMGRMGCRQGIVRE